MTTERSSEPTLLSLGQAAKLTGVRKETLARRVRGGEIAVRVLGKGRAAKVRLTAQALAEAGLLPSAEDAAIEPPRQARRTAADELAVLLELVREQGARIAALEEQRFQLAGQLGAALERARPPERRVGPGRRGRRRPGPTADDGTTATGTGGGRGERRRRSRRGDGAPELPGDRGTSPARGAAVVDLPPVSGGPGARNESAPVGVRGPALRRLPRTVAMLLRRARQVRRAAAAVGAAARPTGSLR